LTQLSSPVAVVAGEGALAPLVVRGIGEAGKSSIVIGIQGFTSDQLDVAEWVHLTQIGRVLRLCRQHGVKELVMAGRVHHRSVYKLPWWRTDWTTLRTYLGLQDLRADSILGAIARLFEKQGIEVAPAERYLGRWLAREGQLTPHTPPWEEIAFGVRLAKELGRLDIGQTVVVKRRAVVALEAMEGTDGCIERASQLAGDGCVVVKMAKPHQDMRFDVPVIGATTVKKLLAAKVKALAVEADRTLLLDPEWLEQASQAGIAVVALSSETITQMCAS
jgi:DUF1009 family protein